MLRFFWEINQKHVYLICSQQVAMCKKVIIQKLCETNHRNKIRPVYWAAMDGRLLIAALETQRSALSHRRKRDK